jgi:hypothetical protein
LMQPPALRHHDGGKLRRCKRRNRSVIESKERH